jgi:hypothetical protein
MLTECTRFDFGRTCPPADWLEQASIVLEMYGRGDAAAQATSAIYRARGRARGASSLGTR